MSHCSVRYNLKTYDFTSRVVNMYRLILQYCRRAMSESILDLIRCRHWHGSDNECILDRDEICEAIKFVAADQ